MAEPKRSAAVEEKLQNLPNQPGVYLYRNEKGKVIYVGKAKNLRSRVRSYFQDSRNLAPRTLLLVQQIRDLDTIIVDSEVEALILEANLIKEHRPRYNVFLKDDKSYPYIRITHEPFPQVFVTRRIVQDGSKYLGPYTDVKHLRHIVKTVRKIFPIRSCKFFLNDEVIAAGKVKLCLDYHIHRCQGPCEGLVSQLEYNRMIRQVEQFLRGKTRELLSELETRMKQEAEKMNFEEAARIRDQAKMINEYHFIAQKVVLGDFEDRDVIALAHEDEDACAVVFKIRDGKVVGRQHFYLEGVEDREDGEILQTFLQQYYLSADYYPSQILLPFPLPEEPELVEKWLSETAGRKVELVVPQIGEKKKLLNLCQKNAKFLLDELSLQKLKQKDHLPFSVRELQKHLRLEKPPRRIEGFDISNIQGRDAVASLVCFEDGRPKKSEYRIFKIRSKSTPDDFAMMHEAVYRRYKRRLEENASLPDLILIDGGKGQLGSALQALQELNIQNQPILGLAKRLEEVFLPGMSDPMNLPKRSAGLKLLQQVRDEAHRFAIGHFHKQHKKSTLKSPLDEVEGIGPARKAHLLKTFGSLKKIKEATAEELREKGKLPGKVAEKLKKVLTELVE
ncbi:MAG: excinuclease ABC subunit C [Calditrichaceae bacterium]|nr:excinuclease ABC subunit UvrC [Calditrichia bacterium]NUQ41824.1 excinuclease ABC subunit C [Calditrichaceae bacterium]